MFARGHNDRFYDPELLFIELPGTGSPPIDNRTPEARIAPSNAPSHTLSCQHMPQYLMLKSKDVFLLQMFGTLLTPRIPGRILFQIRNTYVLEEPSTLL